MKKIGMLVNNLEVSGGYQKLVIRLAQQLQKMGHEVIVYTPKLDTKNCYPNDIISVQIVTVPKEVGSGTPVTAYQQLVQKVEPELDAIIIHDELSLLGVALLPETPGQKIVWMLNNQLPENLRKYRPEVVNVYRQTVGSIRIKRQEVSKAVERVKLMRKGLARVDTFAAYDEYNKRLVQKILRRQQVKVVAAGADLEQFKAYAKERKFTKKSTYQLLSVGVLFPHRRYEDLIRAVALLKKSGQAVRAVIVGRQDLSPDYFKSLQSLTKELAVTKQVTFQNFVTNKEMIELYKKSDIFVFINDGFTWGISVFEAVAAKIPCIITDNIGAADLMKSGKTGWVVSPQNPQAVAEAVRAIIGNSKRTQEMVNRADTELSNFVSWESYTERMLKLL